jgi:hypothetical protein
MYKYVLVCLLLGALAFGQAANPNPAPSGQQPAGATAPSPATPSPAAGPAKTPAPEVAPDAVVITIKGFCSNPAPDKDAAACATTITRAEFEKIVDAVQPSMPPRSRRPFADRYAHSRVMAKKAQDMGLDKSASFEERMRFVRTQILAQELSKALQEQASQVADKDIEDYYHANLSKFDEADLDRIYVPKEKTPPDGEKTPTPQEEQKFQEESEKAMKAEADTLHTRAAAGGDFGKLQEQAFEAAGLKTGAPNASMGKVRRSTLAQTQATVMDMKPGQISDVIADPNGFYIYRLKSKDTMPLDQVHDEIKAILRSQRLQDAMQAVQQSVTVAFDENYFGPEMPTRGPMMPPPRMTPPPPPPKPASAEPK